jgi:tRNA-Thr(GGU) m(6)t(6)A37 methyltransferase TsaA
LATRRRSTATTTDGRFELHPVGRVESPLVDRGSAPKQGDEGSPEATVVFDEAVADAVTDIRAGSQVLILTWLHQADRGTLRVHPRDQLTRPEEGVFSTRSPDRPNPIGLHRVEVLEVDGLRMRVRNLEAIDGTPVVDVKPVIGGVGER